MNTNLDTALQSYSDAMDARQKATIDGLDALDKAFEDAIAKCMPDKNEESK